MDKENWFKRFSNQKPLVVVSNNESCTFEKLTISFNFGVQAPLHSPYRTGKDTSIVRENISIPQKQLFITDPVQRQIFLLEELEKLHKTVVQSYVEPVIRNLALYSGFSTLWEGSNTSDLAQMEIQEKDTLIKLVKSGCAARLVVNLDIYKAISCGFTKEEIVTRVSDLCAICDELQEYNNFEIALAMSMINYEPILILDNALLNFNSNFDSRRNYSFSRWTSDHLSVENTSNEFDHLFQKFHQDNIRYMQLMKFQKISELIFFYCKQKLSEIDIEG